MDVTILISKQYWGVEDGLMDGAGGEIHAVAWSCGGSVVGGEQGVKLDEICNG